MGDLKYMEQSMIGLQKADKKWLSNSGDEFKSMGQQDW